MQRFKDPVCGMEVGDTGIAVEYQKKTYYFCSEGCKEKFLQSIEGCAEKCTYELIIVGGGPAGLTAGVYASIQHIDTLLISEDLGGQAIDSTKVKNYMGFDFITGPQLVRKFQEQLIHHHYIDHKIDRVLKVGKGDAAYETTTKTGKYQTKALIVATGMHRRTLNVPGEERLQRKGVCYRTLQDAPLFSGLDIAVVGGGNSGLQAASELSKIGRWIHLISQGPWTGDPAVIKEVEQIENFTSYEGHDVVEIVGKEKVEGLVVTSYESGQTQTIPAAAVFIEIGLTANSDLVGYLVERNEKGEIVIAPDCSTSARGVYAAGDVTDVFAKRIVVASGEGAKAALAVKKYLSELKQTTEVIEDSS